MEKKKKQPKGINLEIDEDQFIEDFEKGQTDIRQAFLAMMTEEQEAAAYGLIDLEKNIIKMEHYLAHNLPNPVSNQARIEKYKAEYKSLYLQVNTALGKNFAQIYKEVKDEENDNARMNLNNSGGRLYNYVSLFPRHWLLPRNDYLN